MTQSNDAKQPSAVEKPPKNQRSFIVYIAILSIILLALATVYYIVESSTQLNQGFGQKHRALFNDIETLKQQQYTISAQTNAALKTMEQTQNKLLQQVDALEKKLDSTARQYANQGNDWQLLEARYLLELAQINTHWDGNNRQATIALLQQADTLLANIHEQPIYVIRQTLSKEINQLQALPTIDITGLLSKLSSAEDLLLHLPIKKPLGQQSSSSNPSHNNHTALTTTWRERLEESMILLKKIVVIRRIEGNMEPLPTPEQESLLRDKAGFVLQEAEWAILQNNETLYQFALAKALQQINQSFDQTASKPLIQELNTLKQIKLIPPGGISDASLKLLNQEIASRESKPLTITPSATGEPSS